MIAYICTVEYMYVECRDITWLTNKILYEHFTYLLHLKILLFFNLRLRIPPVFLQIYEKLYFLLVCNRRLIIASSLCVQMVISLLETSKNKDEKQALAEAILQGWQKVAQWAQKPNSWTHNFVEVSEHKLERSQTWDFRTQCLQYKAVSNHFCSRGMGE